MPAKKNKRGDRGSTEDETRASKKPKMAATDQTTAIDEVIKKFDENEEEPSLYEIQELLVAINSSLSSIPIEVYKCCWDLVNEPFLECVKVAQSSFLTFLILII